MDRVPNEDPRILEALQACRPGSNDLAEPEMADLAARLAESAELDALRGRLQRLDVTLADAFDDVPVPEGLEARVLARLAEAQPGSVEPQRAVASPGAVAPQPTVAAVPARSRRRLLRDRWWLVAGPALAASILILVLRGHRTPEVPSVEGFLTEVAALFNKHPRNGGKPLDVDSPLLKDYPVSPSFPTEGLTLRWRLVCCILGREVVGYDFGVRDHIVGTLYVLNGPIGIPLRSEPPETPLHNSGGYSAAAWQEGQLVYVLVVDGDADAYGQLLFRGAGPVT